MVIIKNTFPKSLRKTLRLEAQGERFSESIFETYYK